MTFAVSHCRRQRTQPVEWLKGGFVVAGPTPSASPCPQAVDIARGCGRDANPTPVSTPAWFCAWLPRDDPSRAGAGAGAPPQNGAGRRSPPRARRMVEAAGRGQRLLRNLFQGVDEVGCGSRPHAASRGRRRLECAALAKQTAPACAVFGHGSLPPPSRGGRGNSVRPSDSFGGGVQKAHTSHTGQARLPACHSSKNETLSFLNTAGRTPGRLQTRSRRDPAQSEAFGKCGRGRRVRNSEAFRKRTWPRPQAGLQQPRHGLPRARQRYPSARYGLPPSRQALPRAQQPRPRSRQRVETPLAIREALSHIAILHYPSMRLHSDLSRFHPPHKTRLRNDPGVS
jgi:hypothetical protein